MLSVVPVSAGPRVMPDITTSATVTANIAGEFMQYQDIIAKLVIL
jgi:hypothetical protein